MRDMHCRPFRIDWPGTPPLDTWSYIFGISAAAEDQKIAGFANSCMDRIQPCFVVMAMLLAIIFSVVDYRERGLA